MGKEITNVSIDILKVHPRNTEFFDDISGSEYEEFKNSIKEEGIISEIIVSPDMTIISGHQRYKAAKELGIKIVPIRIREDLIDENKKLKVLLAANFGRSKNDDKKQRKVAVEYVKLCGYKHGEIGNGREKNSQVGNSKLSLDEIAKQLGTSKTNLTRALSIERNLTEPMKQLLDDGIISKTVASDLIASLSEDEQIELISSMDTTKKITKNEVQKYINEINQLKSQSAKEKIIDKEIRNKFYRNCLIAYLLALSGGVIYIVIQLLIDSSSDFSSVLNQNVFNFSIILIATPLICLFFDCFTIFRNSELTKTQKIITLIFFVFVTIPFPLLFCSTV